MTHKKRPLSAELKTLGIDPEAWARSRAREEEGYNLAVDIETLVESAAYDRVIELNDGETLLDVWSLLWAGMSRWPLSTRTA